MHNEVTAALPTTFMVEPEARPGQPLGARRLCRVLVVDDDALVRGRLASLLNANQYEVEEAASGIEALRVLNKTPCHIVLTDWYMPDMDGLALCRKVRLGFQEQYVYVLMLTIRGSEDDLLTGLGAGVDDYVVKGASTEEILARVEIGRRITTATNSAPTNNQHLDVTHTDPVTGAHNLGYLMQHLPRELARSQRYGHALAVLTCDIHGFDYSSHQAGLVPRDELLQEFVGRSERCIRKGDWLARTGVDTFMIVLPETTANGARCAARKLRLLFAMHPLTAPDDPMAFTVRIGVTAVEPKHDPDSRLQINALLRAAADGSHKQPRLDADQSTADVSAYLSATNASPRGKNGIN